MAYPDLRLKQQYRAATVFNERADFISTGDKFWIWQARVPIALLGSPCAGAKVDREGSLLVDLRIEDGKLAAMRPAATPLEDGTPSINLGGNQVWPTLVDVHTHLDKSQVTGRIGPLGASFANAREAINADRAKHWNRDDIRRRMDFSIRSAFAHGVGAIRTHIDSYEGQAEASWDVFSGLRQTWSDRVILQATTSVPIDVYSSEYGRKLADIAASTEGGVLGGVLRRSADQNYSFINNIDDLLDSAFTLAKTRGLMVDLHVDETTASEVFHLPDVARAAIRHKMQDRVVCGHCSSLSVQTENAMEAALSLCAEAGVSIVTLPLANLYLQDRRLGRTPRLRGVTALHEIRAKGIPIALASDNVRDAFYPFGDHDPVETFRQSVPIYHLDQNLGTALSMIGPAPARMMGIEPLGSLSVGGPANFIIFEASTLNEIICRPRTNRRVILKGREERSSPPAFSEYGL